MASNEPPKKPSSSKGVRGFIKKLPGTSKKNDPQTPQDVKSEPLAGVSNIHVFPPPSAPLPNPPAVTVPVLQTDGPRGPLRRFADPSSRRSQNHRARIAARQFPPRRPRSEFWGPGLFQCQEHVELVKKISEILDLHGEENLWQPQDPMQMRKVVNIIAEKFMFHTSVEMEDGKEKDTMMVVAAAVFMRLGCRLPSQLKQYTDKLSQKPLPETIDLSARSIQQITQALEIYRPGNFYIFETALLDMFPLLASSQNWERDLWGRDLDEVIAAANGSFSCSYRAVQGVDSMSRAAASLSCIKQTIGTGVDAYSYGDSDGDDDYDDDEEDDDDYDDTDDDDDEYTDEYDEFEGDYDFYCERKKDTDVVKDKQEEKKQDDKRAKTKNSTNLSPAQVSTAVVEPSELVRRPSTKNGETAPMALERIASGGSGSSRKPSLRDATRGRQLGNRASGNTPATTTANQGGTTNTSGRGLMRGFKGLFNGGKKKENST
ncbi:hypothetical protein TWF696_001932 [Orbilia brochopaga]|uniref:Cyclin N-terminal domain-containing protein n=1 Tax=Orbilia brochopaga TaxID=3140254 RepID=A0AAV9U8I8_9PEZI